MPDICITGIGMITCLGKDTVTTWESLCAGRSGIRHSESLADAGCRTTFAGTVNDGATPQETAALDRHLRFAIAATEQALADAVLDRDEMRERGPRVAIVFGTSKGGVTQFARSHAQFRQQGGIASFHDFVAAVPPNAAADVVAHHIRVRGPRHTPVAACATGTIAMIVAAQWLQQGRADIAICGAADACIHPLWIAAFDRMGLTARPHPADGIAGACRPFDAQRSGLAISEGAAALVLETESSYRQRHVEPIARIAGFAYGADPTGLTTMDPQATSLVGVILQALARSQRRAKDIQLVNAHATGTAINDAIEATAWSTIARGHIEASAVTAFKGALGHALGAAGSIELGLVGEMIRRQFILPTVNHRQPGPDTATIRIATEPTSRDIRAVLKLSMGFGGHVAAAILTRPQ